MREKPRRSTFRVRMDEMIGQLREHILTGKLAVHQYLPSEVELGKQFQLSHHSVSKALDVLVAEGLVQKIPKVGNRVAAPSSESATVLRFGYHGTVAGEMGIDALLDQFHARYPHIHVQTLKIPPTDYYDFYKEYMETNVLDLFTMNDANFNVLLEHDAVGLLEPVETDPQHQPFLTEPFTVGGEQLVQPLIFTPLVLCYNKDHFRESGLPEPRSGWSWSDLHRAAERLAVKNKRFGFYFHMLSRNRWPLFLLQSGMTFVPDGRGVYKLDDEKLMEGLDLCKSLLGMENVFPSMLAASNAEAEELFRQQKVSIIITSYSALNELKGVDFPFDIAPLPSLCELRALTIVIGIAINRKSKVKQAAKLLADFLRSYESQVHIHRNTMSIPANKQAAEWTGDGMLPRPSRYYVYRDMYPAFRLVSHLQLNTDEFNAVLREAKLYWSGLYDKETVCANIEQALNALNGRVSAEEPVR